jgi:hypothetical protein
VAVFSYIISEIGYTLSSARKEEEELERSVSTLSEMINYYNIDTEMALVSKEHIINNQRSIAKVYPEDEKAVLDKLSDDLR